VRGLHTDRKRSCAAKDHQIGTPLAACTSVCVTTTHNTAKHGVLSSTPSALATTTRVTRGAGGEGGRAPMPGKRVLSTLSTSSAKRKRASELPSHGVFRLESASHPPHPPCVHPRGTGTPSTTRRHAHTSAGADRACRKHVFVVKASHASRPAAVCILLTAFDHGSLPVRCCAPRAAVDLSPLLTRAFVDRATTGKRAKDAERLAPEVMLKPPASQVGAHWHTPRPPRVVR
jgi:hypothetical protein